VSEAKVRQDDTMTVRVTDRSGWGTIRPYPAIVRVTITRTCPECGGPRGKPYPHRFHEDGEWYTVDRWDNPCGHIDRYEAVLATSRKEGAS
jgi:rRNA maturation protein Nop10